MTDPVHVAAERLLNYFDGDADSGGETLLTYRPYLLTLVEELRRTLDRQTRLHVFDEADHDPATCRYCAPVPANRSAASALHRGC